MKINLHLNLESGTDASADESFYPLRLGPITVNVTHSASEKDNRKKKKKHPHPISAWLLTGKVASPIIYLIILRGRTRMNTMSERDGM